MRGYLKKICHCLLTAVGFMYLSLAILKNLYPDLEQPSGYYNKAAGNSFKTHNSANEVNYVSIRNNSKPRNKSFYNVHHLGISGKPATGQNGLQMGILNDETKIRSAPNEEQIAQNYRDADAMSRHAMGGGQRKLFNKDTGMTTLALVTGKSPETLATQSESLTSFGFPDVTINWPYLCRADDEVPSGTYLLVQVHSHPSHQERRHAIRETWGRVTRNFDKPFHVSLIFILGVAIKPKDNEKVRKEANLYRDIILGNFTDTYNTLSTKSLFGLHWAETFCPEAKFILKTDDDVFLNISRLLPLLNKSDLDSTQFIMGYRYDGAHVMRNGQWKVDVKLYPKSNFPPYCSGVAYVLSSNVLKRLLGSYRKLDSRFILQIEDVFITGILANLSGLSCIHNPQFPNWITSPSISSLRLFLMGELFGLHGVPYTSIYSIYKLTEDCHQCLANPYTLKKWFNQIGKYPQSKSTRT